MNDEDARFAEEDNEAELGFAPEPEDTRRIAPDEPFRRDMILVPVLCGVCRLRMYAQERHIGMWMACPDCGRLAEIRAVEPSFQVVVTVDEKGALTLKKRTEEPQTPAMRVGIDYRTVEGAVDAGAEAIPYYGLDETSSDALENVMDRFLQKKNDVRTPEEIRYERLMRKRTEQKAAEAKRAAEETPEEKKQRLLAELDRHRNISARQSVPGAVRQLDPNAGKAENEQNAHNGEDKQTVLPIHKLEKAQLVQNSSPMPPEISPAKRPNAKQSPDAKHKAQTADSAADYGRPWRHFFRPFFDPQSRRRFGVVWICGFLATVMFLNLYYFLNQSYELNFAANFILFYTQYLIAFLPMAVWGVLLFLNGMTIFTETRDGFNRIRRWIPFRVEFATHYLFWFLILGWIGPFPGLLIGVMCELNRFQYVYCDFNLVSKTLLGATTWFFLFPPLFLSIIANNWGLDLFHPTVWGSLLRRFWLWGAYYILAFLTLSPLPALFYFITELISNAPEGKMLQMIPVFLLTGLVFCTITLLSVHLWFRLLGALAWSVHHDKGD